MWQVNGRRKRFFDRHRNVCAHECCRNLIGSNLFRQGLAKGNRTLDSGRIPILPEPRLQLIEGLPRLDNFLPPVGKSEVVKLPTGEDLTAHSGPRHRHRLWTTEVAKQAGRLHVARAI